MFDEITPDTIKVNILRKITLLSTQQGGFTDDMIGPTSFELFKMYTALNTVKSRVWPDETGGEYLDLEAIKIGLERKQGSKATVVLEITGTIGYVIPLGSAFLTKEDLYFDTTEDATVLPDGKAKAKAVAREVGSKYNALPNTIIIQFTSDSRIEAVTNLEKATGGADAESDKSFFERIEKARKRPSTSGNKYHYEEWALEVNGVGYAKCFSLWNGNGTVKVLIADEQRQPVEQALIDSCFNHIEEVRPVGAQVTVVSTAAVGVDISAELITEPNVDLEKIKEQYVKTLEALLPEISLDNEKIIYHWVGAMLINIEGVINYKSLTINGSNEDIPLTAEQVPVIGEVVLT